MTTSPLICPASVGFWLYELHVTGEEDVGRWQSSSFLIQKGELIHHILGPRFLSNPIQILDPTAKLILAVYDGTKLVRVATGRELGQLLPNPLDKQNEWKVGLSVDLRLRFMFHAEDSMHTKKDTSLGEIIPSGPEVVGD